MNAPSLLWPVNPASNRLTSGTPAMIGAMYGLNLGPTRLVTAAPAGDTYPTELDAAEILADRGNGIREPLPILFATARQVGFVFPLSDVPCLVVRYQGTKSSRLCLDCDAPQTDPALFTVDSSGTGDVAALNEDGRLNSPQKPAIRGTIVTLFGTGKGRFRTTGIIRSGELVKDANLLVAASLRISIGGSDSEVTYAGGAPGLVAGVTQINVRVPQGSLGSQRVPVRVAAGAVMSESSTFVYVIGR